jgi:hypothetical protein
MSPKSLLFAGLLIGLTACGGGGGGGAPAPTPETPSDTSPDIVFKFAAEPLHPRAFNMGIPLGDEENHFYPGDTISLVWDARITYDDNSSISYGEQHIYDAEVFLSNDTELNPDEDIPLFVTECAFPNDSQHSCGYSAHFRCVYAKDNQNNVSCTSLPLNRPLGFADYMVDISSFLDVIPKTATIIFHACLQDEPDTCTEASYPIMLL